MRTVMRTLTAALSASAVDYAQPAADTVVITDESDATTLDPADMS